MLSDLGAFGVRVLHTELLSTFFESREDHDREAAAFSAGVSGTHVRVCAVKQRYSDSNERLGDVCSASRREQSRSLVKFFLAKPPDRPTDLPTVLLYNTRYSTFVRIML